MKDIIDRLTSLQGFEDFSILMPDRVEYMREELKMIAEDPDGSVGMFSVSLRAKRWGVTMGEIVGLVGHLVDALEREANVSEVNRVFLKSERKLNASKDTQRARYRAALVDIAMGCDEPVEAAKMELAKDYKVSK